MHAPFISEQKSWRRNSSFLRKEWRFEDVFQEGFGVFQCIMNQIWLVVWNIFYFSRYLEWSSQLTHIFQRGSYTTNQRCTPLSIFMASWHLLGAGHLRLRSEDRKPRRQYGALTWHPEAQTWEIACFDTILTTFFGSILYITYMIWHDMVWNDMIFKVIWYDIIWYNMMIYYDMIWYDMIWYNIK